MQSETDYLANLDDDSTTKQAYQYYMRVDPEMKDILGPIETVHDRLTGRDMRQRSARVGMIRGAKELKEVTVYLDPFPHIRQDKAKDLQGWYSGKNDGLGSGERDRPCETDAILTQPYGGWCPVGCQFCYINSGTRGYRGSGLMTVPIGFAAHIKKQLRSFQVSAAGYFSSFTDPFLPLEDYYHNTRDGATAFTDLNLPVFFLSRVHYPSWAFDILRRSRYSYAQKSINTPDQKTWKKLSPGAISLQAHLDEIRALRDAGIYVSIQCNPVIPGVVTHEDIERLFEKLAEAGAHHVIVKFVEAGYAWAGAMVERISNKFPDERSARFRELFTENQCGGQRSIVESYRREGHTRYQKKATEVGMTYSLCYEYTKRRDGRWVSMGPEFLTADQCHGHAVPMHRKVVDALTGNLWFVPMDECPANGCLRCAEVLNDPNPCNSDILVAAKALKLPDFRHPWNKPGEKTIPLTVVR